MLSTSERFRQFFHVHRIPREDAQLTLFLRLVAGATGTRDGLIVDIGSGARHLPGHVVRVDVDPGVRPEVVARAEALPFRAGTFAGAIVTDVLMYSEDPRASAGETTRVVRDGGLVYVAEPFLYPDVGASRWRFTQRGLRGLFADLELIRGGFGRGPTSAILPIAIYHHAQMLSFGNRWLYGAWVRVVGLLMSPLVLMDEWLVRWHSIPTRVYTNVYCIARKPRAAH